MTKGQVLNFKQDRKYTERSKSIFDTVLHIQKKY